MHRRMMDGRMNVGYKKIFKLHLRLSSLKFRTQVLVSLSDTKAERVLHLSKEACKCIQTGFCKNNGEQVKSFRFVSQPRQNVCTYEEQN